ncbi:hypothetical protein B0T24DRAFT_720316 [Lasiosphaeria ovina]|uniref:Uncharacterized protein n=1 Tax=Lasiosphaeria ovina TaxID=92902 RepID=A0AAE0KCZ4_9PEZI|nr:hypothetical protein B0T24DRAFT_720316 [Lasiosphaeria ovina]
MESWIQARNATSGQTTASQGPTAPPTASWFAPAAMESWIRARSATWALITEKRAPTAPQAANSCASPPCCGDGRLDAGEECDLGLDNGKPGSDRTADCKLPLPPPSCCGNGIVEPGEACNEGADNGKPGHSRRTNCTLGDGGGGACAATCDPNPVYNKCTITTSCTFYPANGKDYCACRAGYRADGLAPTASRRRPRADGCAPVPPPVNPNRRVHEKAVEIQHAVPAGVVGVRIGTGSGKPGPRLVEPRNTSRPITLTSLRARD